MSAAGNSNGLRNDKDTPAEKSAPGTLFSNNEESTAEKSAPDPVEEVARTEREEKRAAERDRRAILLRAACLFDLVQYGEIDAFEAFERLRPALVALVCGCARQTLRNWQMVDQKFREERLGNWRRRS